MDQGGKPNITQRKTLVLNEPQNLQAQIRKTQISAELFIRNIFTGSPGHRPLAYIPVAPTMVKERVRNKAT